MIADVLQSRVPPLDYGKSAGSLVGPPTRAALLGGFGVLRVTRGPLPGRGNPGAGRKMQRGNGRFPPPVCLFQLRIGDTSGILMGSLVSPDTGRYG